MVNMLNPHRFSRVWQAGAHGLVGVDCTAQAAEDQEMEIFGEAVADGNCTWDDDHGLLLTTTGGDDDQCAVMPAAAADKKSAFRMYTWGPENETHFECVMRTGTLAHTVIYVVGLMLTWPATYDVAVDADQVVFSYLEATDTNWQVDANVGGTDVVHDTGELVVADTVMHFAIRFDKERRAHCFINEREVAVTAPMTAGAALLPICGVEAGTAATKAIYVRKIAMARNWGVN